MAKWGEGDPRWIVEERPDATNVNNWHWTEKNADQWSKAKIKELFVDHIIESPKVGQAIILEVEKCEGEARANNRKGKLIFFYEWDLTLKWKGHVNGNDKEVTGKIEIPNLSEEHDDMEDVDVDISLTTKGAEADTLKEMLRKGEGVKEIRSLLAKYVAALKTEYSTDLIKPKKGNENSPSAPKQAISKNITPQAQKNEANLKNLELGNGVKLELQEINIEEEMKCTGQELYNALTRKDMLQIFTGGEAKMHEQAIEGGSFELLGGNIIGKYIEVTPFTKIVQEWRLKSWPAGVSSHVTITIKQTKDDTKIIIKQKGVPAQEVESTKQGWHRYYFQAMKRSFGFGASLF
jgi:activator of HSP90 ATPase